MTAPNSSRCIRKPSYSEGSEKNLAKAVRTFDASKCIAVCYNTVKQENVAKFSQNPELRDYLMSTGDSHLVGAGRYDRMYGIGLSAANSAPLSPNLRRGQNWLGQVPMEVRTALRITRGFTTKEVRKTKYNSV